MSYTLICSVVEIDKQRLPFGGQSLVIHRKTMILAGDITALGSYKAYRLVVAAVSVFQFVDRRSGRF